MVRGLAIGCWVILLLVAAGRVDAAKLQIKIRATNKTSESREVPVRSALPAGITTNDILSTAGLSVGYDVKSDSYYVHGTIELAPKQIVTRDVEVRDIWVIPEGDVEALATRATALGQALARTDVVEDAKGSRDEAARIAEEILREQRANSIVVVPPVQHIAAFEENRTRMTALRKAVGALEDLALGKGIDVGGELIGAPLEAELPRTRGYLPDSYGEVVLRISVFNPSVARVKRIDLRRDLPSELGIEDVLDAGGLMVREDADSDITYLVGDGSSLPPRETKVFEVTLRDKWNVHAPRIVHLREYGEKLRELSQQRKKIPSVADTLSVALEQLEALEERRGPEEWSSEYVAFYRQQGRDLDQIEKVFNRVDEALAPLFTTKGFTVPAPDRKTTWLVIWSILGFLGIVSFLFFIRWFGRSE